MKVLTGVIHGNTIELTNNPGLQEGTEVEIVIRSPRPSHQPGAGLLRTEGALMNDVEWDGIMDEIQNARHLERQSQGEDR